MRTKPLIFIVDEDESFVANARAGLELAGYGVASANNGPTALESIARLKPNLVVVEMMLPGCSGFRVLHELKERSRSMPVVMLSSFGGSAQRGLAQCMGASEFLAKPVSLNRLTEIVARLTPQPPYNPPHLSQSALKSVEAHAGS
jgi:DNA-binding NtrC family response regulator